MKRDRYLAELLRVIGQAVTDHEIELMRLAIIEARAHIEKKVYAITQAKFSKNNGGK